MVVSVLSEHDQHAVAAGIMQRAASACPLQLILGCVRIRLSLLLAGALDPVADVPDLQRSSVHLDLISALPEQERWRLGDAESTLDLGELRLILDGVEGNAVVIVGR